MTKKLKNKDWTFKRAFWGVLGVAIAAEVFVALADNLLDAQGQIQILVACALGLCMLTLFSLVLLQWPWVFAFFRSVRVGIVAILGVGLGSMLGVLIHQEDPSFPIPALSQTKTVHETGRYRHYLDFRHAQAHFSWKLIHGWGYHFLPATQRDCLLDPVGNEKQLEQLRQNLHEVENRWGKEFALGVEKQSAAGLRVRQENAEIKSREEDWDDFWWNSFRLFDNLDLLRVYRADWFAALFFIIFGGVFSNTFRGGWRRLLKPKKWGFVVTHSGVLILLSASWVGRLTEVRGAVQLHVGDIASQFSQFDLRPAPFRGTEDPFAVRLDSFRADYHDVLQISWAELDDSGRWQSEFDLDPPKYRVWKGLHLDLDSSALEIEVIQVEDQANTAPILRQAQNNERGFAIARVRLENSNQVATQDRFLFHDYPIPLMDSATGLRALMQAFPTRESAELWLTKDVVASSGWVRQKFAAGSNPAEAFPATDGTAVTVQTSVGEYQVSVVRAVPSLRLRRLENGSFEHEEIESEMAWAKAENPAVLLKIVAAGSSPEMRWVAEQEQILPPARHADLEFEFAWDSWSAPSQTRLALALLPNNAMLWAFPGPSGKIETLLPDQTVALPGGQGLRLLSAFSEGVVERSLQAKEGVGFFDPAPGAIRLRVTTPDKTEELVLSTSGRGDTRDIHYLGPDGKNRVALLSFYENRQELPQEWKSRLTVLKPNSQGKWTPQAEGDVRVNDYLHFEGYRFFQRDARPDDPTYSGIGVVFDPALEMVILGLWMVMLGTMIVFFLTPLITRRHRGL